MRRNLRAVLCAAVCTLFAFAPQLTWAVDPNPLQNAYWRFEEGQAFGQVEPRNEDVVVDSLNGNNMRTFQNDMVDATPTYITDVPPKPLKSGLANTLALDFLPNQDIYANGQQINNGIIAPGGGFTVEAAFRTYEPASWRTIIAKEGTPGAADTNAGVPALADPFDKLPTFAMKTAEDTSELLVQLFDGAREFKTVSSLEPLTAGEWYYAAAVNDGSTLSLWLDSGNGYELQESIGVAGALYQGPDPNNPNWYGNWTIGRGQYNNGPADFFNGTIDEVRISNVALSPSQFLFAPPSDGLEGDFNEDGRVDAADYVVWRRDDGSVANYNLWRANFGMTENAGAGSGTAAVPEPSTVFGLLVSAIAFVATRRRGR